MERDVPADGFDVTGDVGADVVSLDEVAASAGQDDAPDLLGKRAVGLRIVEVAVREALGKVIDDAREVRARLGDDPVERAAHIRTKAVFVAVLALAVAGPAHHVIEGFHRARFEKVGGAPIVGQRRRW